MLVRCPLRGFTRRLDRIDRTRRTRSLAVARSGTPLPEERRAEPDTWEDRTKISSLHGMSK